MGDSGKEPSTFSENDRKKLRNELWVVVPFLVMAMGFFLGSFSFKKAAADVPCVIGGITTVLLAMRLYHIIFPHSRIGAFKEAGLGGEFDHLKDKFKEEKLKGRGQKAARKTITAADEKKAFLGLIGCFLFYLLFGYLIGCFLAVIFGCYYYGYKEKLPIAIILASFFVIVIVLLHNIMDAPEDFGLLLTPLLEKFELIN